MASTKRNCTMKMRMLVLAFFFGAVVPFAYGTVATMPSPVNFQTVDTHTTTMKSFLARKSSATTTYASGGMFFAYSSTGTGSRAPADYRAAFGEDYKVNGIVKLSWKGTSGTSTVKITRLSDGNVRTLTTSGTSVDFLAPDVGRNYKWTVTNGGTESGPWYFYTDGEAPRIIPQELSVVGNCRDMGGWVTEDGKYRVRQGLGYRNDHNADFYQYVDLKPFWTDIAGIRTDMDLRDTVGSSNWYCNYELDSNANHPGRSPYGEHWWDVLYWNVVREGDYGAVMNAYKALVDKIGASPASADSKKASVNTWKLFADAQNLPIVVHCSQGRDRTGTVAFVLLGALGVGLNDLYADWALTDYSAPSDFPKKTADEGGSTIVALYNALVDAYPNATYPTLQSKCEKLLTDMGMTAYEIKNLKSYFLEPVEQKLTAVPGGTSVALPKLSASRVTKESAKKPTVTVDTSKATVDYGGGTLYTGEYDNYGKFLVTVTLKDPTTTHWADGTIGPKVLPFIIEHVTNVMIGDAVMSFIKGDTSPHIRIARPRYLGEVSCNYTEEQLNDLPPGDYEATFTAKTCEMASKVYTTTNKFKVYPATEKATYTYEYADLKSAFFKTDYAPAIQTDKVEVRMMDQTAGEGYAPFSCGPYPASMTIMKMSGGFLRYANGAQRVDNDPGTWTVNKIYKLTANGKSITHYDEATAKSVTKSFSAFDSAKPTPGTAYIGCAVEKTANMGAEGTPGYHQPHRLYHVKAWANGSSLIHEFVPCKTTSGYAMLYDKVTKKIYPFSHTCGNTGPVTTGSVTLGGTATKLDGGDDPEPGSVVTVACLTPETNEVGEVVFVERVTNAVPVTAETAEFGDGWYVVTGEVSRAGIDVLEGCTANLILADGASLTVTGDMSCAGIDVRPGETLNVYGQRNGTGRLVATGGSGNGYAGGAGIGGAYQVDGGTVSIYGGTVTVEGGLYASGIGGGDRGAGGTVTIYGGTVAVTGKHGAQGLGGGSGRGGGVNRIYGGMVTAEGGEGAYGIGGDTIVLGDNMVMFNITDGEPGVEITDRDYFCIKKSFTSARPKPLDETFETFGRGWYVTATNGVYINTFFKPDSSTHVEMDVDVGDAQEYWFGCWTNNWDNGAFALGNDVNDEVYCGYGSGAGTHCGGIKGLIPPGHVTVALEKGVVYVNGVVWSDAHKDADAVFALDRNLYLFAQNRAGVARPGWEQERIVCYGCRIWTNDVNGTAVSVRNLIPARMKDELQTVGLYDTVTGEFFTPRGGTLTLGYDEGVGNSVIVTVGELPEHVTAAWTSGDGSLTNAITGGTFEVPKGTENVKVVFTAVNGYLLDKTEVALQSPLTGDSALTAEDLPTVTRVITLKAPADGATVTLYTEEQKKYFALTDEAIKTQYTGFDRSMCDKFLRPSETLSWTGASGAVTVRVARQGGRELVFAEMEPGATSLAVYNLEVGETYSWTVADAAGTSASATFTTEARAPRILNGDQIPSVRDLGGWVGLQGIRIQQGKLVRTAHLDDESTGASLLTDESRDMFLNVIGVKTELDFRSSSELENIGGDSASKLGETVTRYCYPIPSYALGDSEAGEDRRYTNFAHAFRRVFDAGSHPVVFHGKIGRDRTGTFAAMILSLLGVSEDDIMREYRLAGDISTSDSFHIDEVIESLKTEFPASALDASAKRYFTEALGFTSDEVERFRSEMLPGYVPEEDDYSEMVDYYLDNHDFGAETFVEFNRWQQDELLGFLRAALLARTGAGRATMQTDCIKVRIILRNLHSDDWVLNGQIVDAIRRLALSDGPTRNVSLVILGNPDVFPTPQTFEGRSVQYAIRSFDAEGGPIVLTYRDYPITFKFKGDVEAPASLLYGLTFRDCTRTGGHGGAVCVESGDRNCVRLVNCTFQNCTCIGDEGGAVYMNVNKEAASPSPISLQFYPYVGSDLRQADYDGICGSHIYHCTFDGCSATGEGGAIYGNRDGTNGVVVTDCTFRNCKTEETDGGAIGSAKTVYRCTFDQCAADHGRGGGCYNVRNVLSCLFRECTSQNGGGAVDREDGGDVRVIACTFDNCKSQNGNVALDAHRSSASNPVCGCLLFNSFLPNAEVASWTDNLTQSDDGLFVARQTDYHIRPDMTDRIMLSGPPAEGGWTTYAGPSIYADGAECMLDYAQLLDRDGWPLVSQSYPLVAGCYRAYTPEQWERELERLRPYEWKKMNPLEVTVSEDIFDPKDGKISFREACLYLERHQTAPEMICLDQWPKITFKLPAGSRTAEVTNVVSLCDERRAEVFGEGLSGRQPVVIDGGAQGMTIRNIGRAGELLDLSVAGSVNNVLFSGGTVTVGTNGAPEVGKIRVPLSFTNRWREVGTTYENRDVPNELNVRFDNCAFEGGAGDRWLADSKLGNVRFADCSFLNAADGQAKGAVSLNVVSNQISQFECCTFTGFRMASGVIAFMDCGGELRLANCTFADNADVMADVLIAGKPNVHGTFRAFNCIFADGNKLNPTNACVVINGEPNILCPLWPSTRYDPAKKGELMVNIATDSPSDVLDSERITRDIRGVRQCAYRPKHRSTARYGRDSYHFGDGPTMRQPAVDIFQTPQPGAFHSMGSFYMDDVESPSIDVSTSEDVTDPYDDVISLREAIDYGSAASGLFVQGQAVTPTFGDGVTSLSVTGAIRIATNTIYRDFALVIEPGKGQSLTISSATNSSNGVFAQETGTKLLQFRKVTFDGCGSVCGDGGVLMTDGTYRFDDCAFSRCWAAGCGGAVAASKSADGIFHNVSASGCLAAGAGGVIANAGRLVGVNLTFCRNAAASGAAVHCSDGTNLFASVAFVDNVSATNGAVHAEGGVCGIVNSLIVGNVDSAGAVRDFTAADGVMTDVQYTLSGADVTKAEVFTNGGEPVIAVTSNEVEQLYYPLDLMGKASGTGAYVFFLTEKGGDDLDRAGWIKGVLYSTEPDDFNLKPLVGGKAGRNTRLLQDLLGNLIECWDLRNLCALPASMGPVPKTTAVGPSAVVTTTKDAVDATLGTTTLRAAAEYAMSNGMEVTFADGLFSGGKAVLELGCQIDVPKDAALRINAGSGRTVELQPVEAEATNRFFNVFGSLSVVGLTMRDGRAGSDDLEMSLRPVNDADGGAVIGYGPMAFTNCNFIFNMASGHGGAIYSCGGLSLSGCTFVSNRAEQCGGAVYSKQEDLFVSGTTLVENSAGVSGGGVYVYGSTNAVQIIDSEIVANHAVRAAGGLYLEGAAEDRVVEIRGIDTWIVGNTAGESSDNVFVEEWAAFDESNVNRVPNEYVRVVTDGGLPRIVLDEEKATPVLVDFSIGDTADGKVSLVVDNVVIALKYGVGRAETPAGPYVVDEWTRATSASPLKLTAPKTGAMGFFRVMANVERAQVEDDGSVTLSVPMPADKGFMILKSKGASK